MAVDYANPNLQLWSAVEKTDPAYTKPITGKAYKGTSPSPHWIKLKLTEQFGPAGYGWGVRVLDQQFITLGDTMMHYVTIELWYVIEGKRCSIEECGGTQLGGKRKSGDAFMDEDAPKKSVTDALVKAASAIGFCADIFLGRWDDNKYVEARTQEEAQATAAQRQQQMAQAKAEQEALLKQVGALIDQLAHVTVADAFAACRAEAMDLRVRLKQHGLSDSINQLGEAVIATNARIIGKGVERTPATQKQVA